MSECFELFASTQLLVKQPEHAGASLWQGALVGGE
jgi:hypothetical protein